MTRPPDVCTVSPTLAVPAWKTTTSVDNVSAARKRTCVDLFTWRNLSGGDGFSLFKAAWVSRGCQHHRNSEAWPKFQRHGVQSMFNASLQRSRASTQGETKHRALTRMTAARSVSSERSSISASVSGSPKRTLYSSTFGPESVNIKPVNRRPTKG
jgi:hypothetical protein